MKTSKMFRAAVAGLAALASLPMLAGCAARPPRTTSASAHSSDANAQSQRIEQQILQTRSARTRMKRAAGAVAAHPPEAKP